MVYIRFNFISRDIEPLLSINNNVSSSNNYYYYCIINETLFNQEEY